ncbi:MAG: hypothetical protein FJX61_16105 [Alphaproteobacteria bacterium]|nr:hypothetical protein [Alphaproteobacteria bacterium]
MSALGTTLPVFLLFTLVVMGGAAYLTGQALARTWKPPLAVLFASVLLAAADRFLAWGLFGQPLGSIVGYGLDFVVLLAIALLAHRLTHVAKMVAQYPWLYARDGLFAYRPIPGAAQAPPAA